MSQPSRVRVNVAANLAGNAWLATLGLLFPPIFARWMGVESYGLVGFYTSLIGLLSLFDLGLGMTLGREVARLSSRSGDEGAKRDLRDLLRTFEGVYGGLGLLLSASVAALAPLLARHALNRSSGLPEADVVASIRWMSLALGAQFAQAGYAGVMTGLQRQVTLNALQALTGTVKHGTTLAVLYAYRRDAPTYFVCQAFATIFALVALRTVASRAVSGGVGARPVFRVELLRRNAAYASGVWSNYLVSIVLSQADKFAVGKLLPLADFGYYALALTAGNALNFLVNPLFSAVVPRFTQLHEAGDRAGLTALYRKASQAMVALVLPGAVALVTLRHEVLSLWSRSEATANMIGTTFALRASATALNSLVYVPFALSLATGAARASVLINGASALAFVPLELVLIPRYGIAGAALGWLAVTLVAPVAWQALVRRRGWLDERFWPGLWRNVACPALACLIVSALARRLLPAPHGALATLASLAAIAAPATLAALVAARDLGPALSSALGRALARRPSASNP